MSLLISCMQVAPKKHSQANTIANPFTLPASAYLALAANQTGEEKQSLLILAAGRLISEGEWKQASLLLMQTDSMPTQLNNEKYILQAKIHVMRAQPRLALQTLAKVNEANLLPLYYQAQFHEILASTYQSINQFVAAISERIKLDALLQDESSKMNNARALWLALTSLPQAELETLSLETNDQPILNGWIELAQLARKTTSNPEALLNKLQQWQAKHPAHPGQMILPTQITSLQEFLFNNPKHIALLLPLTGPLAGPGNAIHDGFMAAYQTEHSNAQIRRYNTDRAQISTLYQQALNDGADYIVGPLSKADVNAIAMINHPVPTLLLNDVNTHVQPNAYTFGLSPQNEARQVAARAHKQGLHNALIIAPNDPWGETIVTAFTNQWTQNGGQINESLRYSNTSDLNTAVRQLLHINSSESRERSFKKLFGEELESTPSRRHDFDVVFLVAYPSKARQIMPLLRYYYAGDVPVYATSSVYSGNQDTVNDRDLNGIIFCDMPWVFTHQMGQRNWPEQFNSYNRLYALGMDSYSLATQLNALLLFPALGVRDQSGVLYLSDNQQITRILAFGQFQQGVPMRLSN